MKGRLYRDEDGYWLDLYDNGITKMELYKFGQLSKENCDRIFEPVNKNKLSEETYREFPTNPKDKIDWSYNRDVDCFKKRKSYVKGFDKAMDLMKGKLFTVEDMKQAMLEVINLTDFQKEEFRKNNDYHIIQDIIRSLEQSIEVKLEMEINHNINKEFTECYTEFKPKLDEDGCLILNKI
jgi:hypothetical protein